MRVLFLTHRLPYAPNRGDRVRAFNIARTLGRHVELDVVSLAHDAHEEQQADLLEPLVASVSVARVNRLTNSIRGLAALPTNRTLTHALLHAAALEPAIRSVVARRKPDVVLAYCSSMAAAAMAPPLGGIPMVLDLVDVDSQKWDDLAAGAGLPLSWIYRREARLLARFEARAASRARAVTVVNNREADLIRRLAPHANVRVVDNGVDLDGLRRPTLQPRNADVVFCGVMNYAPNAAGAMWLAREVWPLVRARRPDARLFIVGARPARAVRQLADVRSGVHVTGTVPDVQPYLWQASAAAAPLHVARGVQNKVLEAVAAGLPAVVTPAVMRGLPATVLPACTIAGNPEHFADALVETLNLNELERAARVQSARLERLDWTRTLAPLLDLVRQAAAEPGRFARSVAGV